MDNTNNRKTGSGKLKQQILSLFKTTAFVRNSNLELVKNKSTESDKDNLALEIKELKKLRLVFEQTPGAIFILDTNFCFEYVNPGYEKLSGFSKAELIGKSVTEIFSQTDYTEPREEIVKSMIAGEKWEGEMQTYKKDGSTYWATTVSSPFKDDNGNLEGYIIIQQDVSDRKK
ncbi:putative PAS/PAC sensor protein [Paludibacter propionicigenes WB4]|uniref:Putative PAS/PAC sensor protein n=1 Tax=Paludibacter propionicigenes (strain DSM 17365 / JCM 13257 / WB4) TaxID=694427 RepID=E4T823_PALPW|nr:PAS domain-containing protein [Paludibacter propionicigenes]ADQ80867.1 putative PAS/PAC sensor protein [Paludibacter propionicigenes WB4]